MSETDAQRRARRYGNSRHGVPQPSTFLAPCPDCNTPAVASWHIGQTHEFDVYCPRCLDGGVLDDDPYTAVDRWNAHAKQVRSETVPDTVPGTPRGKT